MLYRNTKKGESLKYHPGVKSMRAPYAIFADIESLLKKMDACTNDPDKSSTTQLNKHEIVVIHWLNMAHLMRKNNKLDYYRVKDCLKKFCQDLKKQAKSIVDFEKK